MTVLHHNITINVVATINEKKHFTDARFSIDGKFIITKSDNIYECWNATTGDRLETFHHDVSYLKAFFDHPWYETGCHVLDEKTAAAVGNNFNGWSDLVVVSPNGQYVAFGSCSGYLGVFDLENNMPLILHGHDTTMNNHMHQNSINAMLFDSSSSYLISVAEEDCNPLLWDLTATSKEKFWNQKQGRMLDHPQKINEFIPSPHGTIAFSPVESKLVTTHPAIETAQVWEIIRAK